MSLPPRDHFGRQWLAFILVLGSAFLGWHGAAERLRPTSAPRAPRQGAVDWFFVLRLPAVTPQYAAGVEVMTGRYDSWLSALGRAGFHPIRLSEAVSRLESGRGLPERSVVAVFEPGLRRTKEVVDPVFRRRGWPAVWLTDTAAMRAGSRELVTFRDARLMSYSGWWDVGYARAGGGYELRSRDGRVVVGAGGPLWSPIEGTFALNRGAARRGLSVLTVNPEWAAAELVDRLRAELPFERRTCLSKAVIHGREWGVPGARADSPAGCAPFDVEAPPGRRDDRLHWLGTAGMRDVRLALEATKIVGELRLHFLRDEVSGSQISVVFAEKAVYVDQWRGGEKVRLLSAAHRRARGPVSAVVTLEGGRLSLETDGGPAWVSPPLALPERGLLVLQVSERIRGVARVEGLRMTFEPQAPAAIAQRP